MIIYIIEFNQQHNVDLFWLSFVIIHYLLKEGYLGMISQYEPSLQPRHSEVFTV